MDITNVNNCILIGGNLEVFENNTLMIGDKNNNLTINEQGQFIVNGAVIHFDKKAADGIKNAIHNAFNRDVYILEYAGTTDWEYCDTFNSEYDLIKWVEEHTGEIYDEEDYGGINDYLNEWEYRMKIRKNNMV
jgi:hypothetical protein